MRRARKTKTQLSYGEKLKDVRWQKKRLETLDEQDWRCQNCDAKEGVTLNVHHNYYLKGKDPWEYELDQLTVLCDDCHEKTEKLIAELKVALSRVSLTELPAVLGFVNCSVAVYGTNPPETIPCRSFEEADGIAARLFTRSFVYDVLNCATPADTTVHVSRLRSLQDKKRVA